MTTTTSTPLRTQRMTSLLLADAPSSARSVADVVRWFGALQGQDLGSVQWSLGLRTGVTREAVSAAMATGEILRTWPMRGTLHVVPGEDARWMLEHLGGRALRGAAARRAFLGLDERDADRAADMLGLALAGGQALTRAECIQALEAAGISTAGQRAYHLLWYASQKGVTCVGPQRGTEQTFVLLEGFAPVQVSYDRAEALAVIAARFVRSHGPVSAHDLARWADLTVGDARAGLAGAGGITTCTVEGRDLFVAEDQPMAPGDVPAHALPGFDELVLGYKDRSAQMDPAHEARIVPGGNGVFSPTLVLDGRVVGTWKRKELTRSVQVAATPLVPVDAAGRDRLEVALGRFGEYVGKPVTVDWADPPNG